MKTFFVTALFALVSITAGQAGTFAIPEESPLATITVPSDGWKTTRIERGIELESSDDEVYFSIEAIRPGKSEEVVLDALKQLMRGGVKVDNTTKKMSEGKLLGYQFDDLGYTGKDKDGDVVIHLSILTLNAQEGILFTYWGSPEGEKKHDPAIQKMINTMKFTK